MKQPISIIFGGNYKVFDGVLLALISMTKHCKDELNIYVITADLRDMHPDYRPIEQDNLDILNDIVKKANPNSFVKILLVGEKFNDWVKYAQSEKNKKLHNFTPFTYLRLFADSIPELPTKLLYLDIDVMINGNIADLYNTDITDYEVGVVKDRYGKFFISPKYFNAGMLLLNMDKIKEKDLFSKAKDLIVNKQYFLGDQTALNKVFKKKKYLPRRFNEQGDLRKDTVVQHFCNRLKFFPKLKAVVVKPWQIDKVHNIRKNFAYEDIYEEFNKIKGGK